MKILTILYDLSIILLTNNSKIEKINSLKIFNEEAVKEFIGESVDKIDKINFFGGISIVEPDENNYPLQSRNKLQTEFITISKKLYDQVAQLGISYKADIDYFDVYNFYKFLIQGEFIKEDKVMFYPFSMYLYAKLSLAENGDINMHLYDDKLIRGAILEYSTDQIFIGAFESVPTTIYSNEISTDLLKVLFVMDYINLGEATFSVDIESEIENGFFNKFSPENQELMLEQADKETLITEVAEHFSPIEKTVFKSPMKKWQENYSRVMIILLCIAVCMVYKVAIDGDISYARYKSLENTWTEIDKANERLQEMKSMPVLDNMKTIDISLVLRNLWKYIPQEHIKSITYNTEDLSLELKIKYSTNEDVFEAISNIGNEFRMRPLEEDSVFHEGELFVVLDFVNQ